MNKNIKKIIHYVKVFVRSNTARILFFIGFLAFFCFILHKNKDYLDILSLNNLPFFSVMLAVTFINICNRGLINVITFSFERKKINLWEGCKLATINTIGNYLPLSGGLIAKGFILKKKYNISYTHYTAISVYTFITLIAVSGFLGLYSTLIIQPISYVLLLGFGVMALLGTFIFVPVPKVPFMTNYCSTESLHEARIFFRSVVLWIIIIYAVLLIMATFRLSYSFSILGQKLTFVNVLLLISGSALTRLITITPGAVGVREAIVATLAHLIGMEYQLAIIAVGIDRLAEIIVVFATYGIILLWERLKSGIAISS